MSEQPQQGSEYDREREFKVILEDLRSQFRAFGEGLDSVRGDVHQLKTDMTEVKEDVAFLKFSVGQIGKDVAEFRSAFPRFVSQVSDQEKRLTALEKASR